MTPSPIIAARASRGSVAGSGFAVREWLQECWRRSPALTLFGLVMWLMMIPALVGLGLDERSLRGVNVWVKPLKFMASVGLFSLCTAWFVGLLPEARRHSPAIRLVVWTLVLCGGFEVVYITLMAAMGEASHYNFSGPLQTMLYSAMGLGALAMTATQPVLAWQIARHAHQPGERLWRESVILGLVLTFVLGAGAGGMLGGMQPPSGAGLPIVGWHLAGGDLRPAHFLGMHAQQLFPLLGWILAERAPERGRALLLTATCLYGVAWVWLLVRGLDGAVRTLPPGMGG